mgnify:FL=1
MILCNLVCLFIFVKKPEHVIRYIILVTCSSCIANLINGIHSRKYIQYSITDYRSLSKYIKPTFIIFFAQIASVVYLNMDSIMLGFISGDRSVGLYSASTKFNSLISALITSVSAVVLPRLSYYLEKGENSKFDFLVRNILKYFIFLSLPCILGLIPISYDLITWFCGNEFFQAGFTMRIMLLDLFWSLMNGFIAYQVCIPYRNENSVLISTSIGAIVNIILNAIFIPFFNENGAAIATLISEICVFIVLVLYSKKYVNFISIFDDIWQIIIACISFIPVYLFIYDMISIGATFLRITLYIVLGGVGYLLILFIMKNYIFSYLLSEIKNTVVNLDKRRKSK